MANSKILTAEQEMKLRQPIDDYVGKIQTKIDSLRVDGTDKVVSIQNKIDGIKRDRTLSKDEKDARINKLRKDLDTAKAVEAQNKDQISKLIADAEGYLKAHFDILSFFPQPFQSYLSHNRQLDSLILLHSYPYDHPFIVSSDSYFLYYGIG